jgi:hypothetical protein
MDDGEAGQGGRGVARPKNRAISELQCRGTRGPREGPYTSFSGSLRGTFPTSGQKYRALVKSLRIA